MAPATTAPTFDASSRAPDACRPRALRRRAASQWCSAPCRALGWALDRWRLGAVVGVEAAGGHLVACTVVMEWANVTAVCAPLYEEVSKGRGKVTRTPAPLSVPPPSAPSRASSRGVCVAVAARRSHSPIVHEGSRSQRSAAEQRDARRGGESSRKEKPSVGGAVVSVGEPAAPW